MERLYTDLIELFDLQAEDTVFISSDIAKLALYFKNQGVAFNADHFIDLLQQRLSNGTIVIPAYTDLLKNGQTFDRQKSKPTTGALSNRVFKRKDFFRTADPLHSVFVWGKDSEMILSLKDESTFGDNSIFGYLDRVGAEMIIIDVHFENSFTFVHYVEEKKRVSFRKPYHWKINVIDQGQQREQGVIFYTKKAGYLVALDDLQNKLIMSGVVVRKEIYDVPILMMNLTETRKAVENYLDQGEKTYDFSWKIWMKQMIKQILGRK